MKPVSKYTSLTVYAEYDPTKTTALRNLFARDLKKRFAKLTKDITSKVVTEDAFGLAQKIHINEGVSRATFAFPRTQDKVEGFMAWLDKQVKDGILQVKEYEQIGSAVNTAWTNKYIEDSYKRGVIRARYELDKAGFDIPTLEETGGVAMSMATPFHMDRLGLLYGRVFTDLKGITSAMDTQISRILAQGLADGDNPRLLAKKLVSTINGSSMGDLGITDKLGRFIPAARRAEVLARTEIIRAHHQATIQEYKNWAVEGVIVKGEWLTAEDGRVCEQCKSLEGKVFTLDVIDGMIPLHPQCRCIALPTKVDASISNPAETQAGIQDIPIQTAWKNLTKVDEDEIMDRFMGLNSYVGQAYSGAWKNMDADYLVRINKVGQELTDLYTKYPELLKKMIVTTDEESSLVILLNPNKSLPGMRDGVLAYYQVGDTSMVIGNTAMSRMTPQLAFHQHNVGVDFGSVFRHEYGHHVWQAFLTKGEKAEITELFKRASPGWIQSTVSEYALTNEKEFFSEIFAAYTSPLYDLPGAALWERKYLPTPITDILEKILKVKK